MNGAALGARIRELRKQRGMSQRELSRRAKVNSGYLSMIETGQRVNPSDDKIARIALVLDVDPAQIAPGWQDSGNRPSWRQWIDGDRRLTAGDREILLALVERLRGTVD